MALEIIKGSAKFEFGWSSPEDLSNWLFENPELIGVSFVRRSNVGKSSMINSLFGRQTARVSKTPGRTREINVFSFELANDGKPASGIPRLYLFDLPGYGHAEVSKEMSKNWENLMGVFFQQTSSNVVMVNLQDARHPDQKADQGFHQFLKKYNFSTFLAFNKIDKLKKQKERAALNKLKPQLFKAYKWVKQIHFVSAESKTGLPALHDALIAFFDHRIKLGERKNGPAAD